MGATTLSGKGYTLSDRFYLNWHEVNGAHAFMRDEGPRYDPELAYNLYGIVLDFFHRKLAAGDLPAAVGVAEIRH